MITLMLEKIIHANWDSANDNDDDKEVDKDNDDDNADAGKDNSYKLGLCQW